LSPQIDFGKMLREAIGKFLASPGADKKAVEELVRGIQRALIIGDVDILLVKQLSDKIKQRALSEKLPPGISRKEHIVKIVYEELVSILGQAPERFTTKGKKPYLIMLVGIQGSGKTTTAAKLANYLVKEGYKVGVVCADTYRPGAYQQLRMLLEPRGIPVYGEPDGKDSIKIAKNGVEAFKRQGLDVIIIDTAGRHKEQEGLMQEMREMEENLKPDEVMLVIDGTIGQTAKQHAEAFNKATKLGSIIITKLDTSAKGGGALSAVAATGAQIKFIGVGEKIEELELFKPTSYISTLLGMPDLESIVERVRLAEVEMSEEKVKAMLSGRFTLEDMVNQLKEMRKLGPLQKMLSKLAIPGMPELPAEELEKAEERIKKWSAIIQSMTKEERVDPGILNDSRIRRIARGSGTSERDVKELLKNYQMAKKMMKGLKRAKWKMPKQLMAR